MNQMDDPQVLGYWWDWLKVKDSAIHTGWTFAVYVVARVQAELPVTVTSSGTNARTMPPWLRD